MVDELITLMAIVVMIFTHVWMAIMARNDSKAKGSVALLFLCCPPFALLYFVRMPKRKKRKGLYLHWIFLAAASVVIYRVA